METALSSLLLQAVLQGAGERLDEIDIQIAVNLMEALQDGDTLTSKLEASQLIHLSNIFKIEELKNLILKPSRYIKFKYNNREISIDTQSKVLTVTCLGSSTTTIRMSLDSMIWFLLANGVVRRSKIDEFKILADNFLQALENLKQKLSNHLLVKTGEKKPPELKLIYYHLQKDGILERADKYGATVEVPNNQTYLILSKDRLQTPLVLQTRIATYLTSIETREKVLNADVSAKWIETSTFIQPCATLRTVSAGPEELRHYQVAPEDKIRLEKTTISLVRSAKVYFPQTTRYLALENLFEPAPMAEDKLQEGSLHRKVQERLVELGALLGFYAELEHNISGFRIDVVWMKGNGRIEYAFEIVAGGSVAEAVYRLLHVEAAHKVLVVADDRLEEAKEKAESRIKILPISKVMDKRTTAIRSILV